MARRAYARKRGGKFNVAPAKDRRWRGKTYDSQMEMRFAQFLAADPGVCAFSEQPQILMGTDPCIRWRLDFWVEHVEDGIFYAEVTGMMTPEKKRKIKLYRTYGNLPLKIVTLKGNDWLLLDYIVPEPGEEQC